MERHGNVEVYNAVENGKLGLGVRINGPASVQDLLDAWQPWCDDQSIFKQYAANNHDLCKGCQSNCCNTAYVIPDLIAFKKMAVVLDQDWGDLLVRYFHQEKRDVGILRLQPNPCVFLKNNVCTIYAIRSLICRFYLCSPLLGETEELIYKIAWSGAAATQIFAQEQGLIAAGGSGASSFDRLFIGLLDEYQGSAGVASFLQAQGYEDVPLHNFLPMGKEVG
ncbi:MAG: YkgJ family cysteine cluster protein [Syntrophomonadaceae bacterium]|nr:YkgJ family cysteine cluster protein [Syntrophomonadaceae bacterium]